MNSEVNYNFSVFIFYFNLILLQDKEYDRSITEYFIVNLCKVLSIDNFACN